MKIKLACLGLAALLAATGAAQAGDFSFGGPQGPCRCARADPGAGADAGARRLHLLSARRPRLELRGRSVVLELGASYGTLRRTYSGLDNRTSSANDVFIGTIGAGAYFTPHMRGDLTLDFLTRQDIDASATYPDPGPPAVNGVVTDRIKLNRVVGLANLYWDLLPRGQSRPMSAPASASSTTTSTART